MLKTIFLVRHTETVKINHLIGASDVPLPLASLERLQSQLDECPNIQKVISSPRQRCSQAARIFSEAHQVPLEIEPKIQEMDFGDWDGHCYEWLWQNTANPSIGDFWQDPWSHTPPNGEPMTSFERRVESWWQEIVSSPNDDAILVVTHGGVIKALLAIVLALPHKSATHLNCFEVGYGCIVRFSVYYDNNGVAWPKVVF
ncbi:histidine phosphatase family protein [Pseudoalteromonas luteoviolacea]|uniref:Alpha-ribazole phosphatase n=1 Tax=Pseudoalteromonas luteoviolacea S4060-1 TaxID=1365257 RepID=A0A167I6B2_9GAMM|nr:histidine phosphatase family protein [Pseudoalteromonas luteoviolacea]KZN58958.1 hypothetical protein N478_09005 [Pseudoalteromonas luteoviolacea S4060-1]